MIKIRWSDLLQQITEFWAETVGYDAAVFESVADPAAGLDGPWPAKGMLYSRVTSIYGGSSEIQHNIVARRALGL
jgi:alkylation response protein AidB-like acyl-CoA dehydrogenase